MTIAFPAWLKSKGLSAFAAKGGASAALVLHPHAVELAWRSGSKAPEQIRVEVAADGGEALAAAIRQAVASAKLKSRRMAVSVASPEVLVRFFTMPMLPKSEWESAVQFEARKYIPFKMETLVWDYVAAAVPPHAAEHEMIEAVFVGIPREAFDRLGAVLAAAGVQPVLIEPFSRTLARSAARKESTTQFECAIELRPQGAHLVVARGGIPYLTRDVHAAPAGGAAAETGPAASLAQRLSSELSLSLDFFKREYASAVVARVMLFGADEAVAECRAQLAPQAGIPVEGGATLPLLAPALALLEDLQSGRGGSAINFLSRSETDAAGATPGSLAAKLSPAQLLTLVNRPEAMITALATMAGVTLICWVLGSAQVARQQHGLTALQRSRAPAASGLEQMGENDLTPLEAQLNEQLSALKQAIDGRPVVSAKLDALVRSMPDGVWLTGLDFQDRVDNRGKATARLVINGACFLGGSNDELKAIQEFEARIKRDPTLAKGAGAVQLGQVSATVAPRASTSYRTFQLQCQTGTL